jgi:glycosyltransferase involved in cell wall biosynthesis
MIVMRYNRQRAYARRIPSGVAAYTIVTCQEDAMDGQHTLRDNFRLQGTPLPGDVRRYRVATGSSSRARLSIVIPAHNEERRLPASLEKLDGYVATLDREVEVIVVENGSTDATAFVTEQMRRQMPYLRLLRVPQPGKGRAVRAGMLAATGDFLMFCDVDFSMPVEGIDAFLALLDAGAPIVLASRELATSVRYREPARRHIMGRVFNVMVQTLLVRGIADTQCGFKAFQRAVARDLFGRQRLHGWAFDVELLYLARWRGYRMQQVAIDWYYDGDSRVRGLHDSLSMVAEILRIRFYALVGRYGLRYAAPGADPEPAQSESGHATG